MNYLTITGNKVAYPPLPHLRVLKLWGPMQFDDGAFADMVQSRRSEPLGHGIARLESISLRYHREWDRMAIGRLERFRDEGLGLGVHKVLGGARWRGYSA